MTVTFGVTAKGANIFPPQVRVDMKDRELAFGIVICFGSAEFLPTALYIDASLHSPTTPHASASPTAFLVSCCARRLAGVPARRIRRASVGPPR